MFQNKRGYAVTADKKYFTYNNINVYIVYGYCTKHGAVIKPVRRICFVVN